MTSRSNIGNVVWSILLLAAFAGGALAWHKGMVVAWLDAVGAATIRASTAMGIRVSDVMVVGRERADGESIMRALGVRTGSPLMVFDPMAAKGRIESLPWVKAASVERVLPDTLLVRLVEHQPLAIWQNEGRFHLIDAEGLVIVEDDLGAFRHLPLVVGEDAPRHAAELIRIMKTEPRLMARVTAAVRVGNRRWNVRLENGIDVHLPEYDTGAAWARLAEYELNHRLLDRDIAVLDMRLPDRLIVRRTNQEQPARPPAAGRTT